MSALSLPGLAFADPSAIPVSISAGPLSSSLRALQRQTGIELLYDRDLVANAEAPGVQGKLAAEEALRQLVTETSLTVRRTESGAWIIEQWDTSPLAQQDAEVAEILIVGRRTQNADIRRVENDVQPYTVVTGERIVAAHRDNLEQYFNSHITSNTQVVPAGLSQTANTLSEVDLRGLGSRDTLVLVDGRRMPSLPYTAEFRQPDFNAIPLHAIARVEVLTGTAGGIHGFGALGGVVNVVLDRETRGVNLYVTEGLSSRGDGHRQSVEAGFGHTSENGATDFMVFASHTHEDSIVVSDRNFEVHDRKRTFDLAPEYAGLQFPYGNSLSIRSLYSPDPPIRAPVPHPNLTFKPEFGGATLPSYYTFLPAGFSGNAAALTESLTRNAGQTDFTLPKRSAASDLGPNPRSDALLANVRHRFGMALEAYADLLLLKSRGESYAIPVNIGARDGRAHIAAGSPANPFTDDIEVDFPIEGLNQQMQTQAETSRYTGGVVANLPFGWRGTAEFSLGAFRYSTLSFVEIAPDAAPLRLLGDPSDLNINPLGDWSTFQRAVGANRSRYSESYQLRTRFRDRSLRLAGPVFSTAAGPTTLTLLAEHRTQDVPAYSYRTTDTFVDWRTSGVTSFYAELRPRLFSDVAPAPFLRGLELQLAIRRDEQKDSFPRDTNDFNSERLHTRFIGTTFTAGAKISPTGWLMLRGSYATGEQPPPLDYLVEMSPLTMTDAITTDPKRGGTGLGADGAYLSRFGGNADLKSTRASTLSVGTVLTPTGPDGVRLAFDLSRIRRTRDPFSPPPDPIVQGNVWPGRVTRAPLTDEDRARGYTAGRITLIDLRFMNGASLEVDTLDMHAGWPLTLLGGRLQLYSDATYYMSNLQKAPLTPDVHVDGYRDGPLRWRANVGFAWSTDQLTIGGNLQYYGRYRVLSYSRSILPDLELQLQGSSWIPSQSYLDLHARWRIPFLRFGGVDDVELDFGIVNVLDSVPPRENAFVFNGPSYSRYGDPRQRRFELTLSTYF